jgi:glycosyltransferase involved in cell wall biosynthesis
MDNKPLVTVIMPVYNGERFLFEAIESILNQSYKDIELIVIDDGSTDRSVEIINSFESPKLNFIQNKKNLGVCETRNKGFKLARGEYIALMDADDISVNDRIKKQVLFMEENKEYGLISANYESFREHPFGVKRSVKRLLNNSEQILAYLLFTNVICCPCSMIRTNIISDNNLYFDTTLQMSEDFDLWKRISAVTKITNINEVLLKYRKHTTNSTKKRSILNRDFTKVIQKSFDTFDINIRDLFNENFKLKNVKSFICLNKYLEDILEKNKKTNKYNEKYLSESCSNLIYWMFLKHIDIFGYNLYTQIKTNFLFENSKLSKQQKIKLFFMKITGK